MPVFRLQGVREIISIYPEAVRLERHIKALERALAENPSLAFDLAKSLIETICKTILKDRGVEVGSRLDAQQLVRETLRVLQLLPNNYPDSSNIAESLRKTIRGLQTTIQGLCELRNREGMSHGQDAFSPMLETIHAILAAQAADTIASFLFKIHKSYTETDIDRIYYQDYKEFNQYIDENNELIRIFNLKYLPSEVLFYTDEKAYRDLLYEYLNELQQENDGQT